MAIEFGDSGYGWDAVNGLYKTGRGGGEPMTSKTPNRQRFERHKVDMTNEKIFGAGVVCVLVLVLLFHWFVPAIALAGALVYWMYWSGLPAREMYCETDPATGLEIAVDDGAKRMLGYGGLFRPFVDKENKLLDILVSAKTMPPEMNDTTVRWTCVEFDDAKTVFEIEVAPVNGVVSFIQKNLKDIAAAFGDPNRYEFHKKGDDERTGWSVWQLTVFDLPKNISAGVSWG